MQEYTMLNSYGLKLTSKTNYALVYSSATANDEMGETKVGFAYRFITDLDNLNQEEFAKEVAEKTISQFGSAPCASGKYKCVFSPSATSSLLEALLSNVSADYKLFSYSIHFYICHNLTSVISCVRFIIRLWIGLL